MQENSKEKSPEKIQERIQSIPVTCLVPNPFDKGSIDPSVVQKLLESFRAEGGFSSVTLRVRSRGDGFFECTDGKHRLQAIREFCQTPKATMVRCLVSNLTDQQMWQGLIHPNFARRVMTNEDWTIVIQWARDYLKDNPSACTRIPSIAGQLPKSRGEKSCKDGVHGGSRCIAAFLDVEGLSFQKVSRLLYTEPEETANSGVSSVDSNSPQQEPTPVSRENNLTYLQKITQDAENYSEKKEQEAQALRDARSKPQSQPAQAEKSLPIGVRPAAVLAKSLRATITTYQDRLLEVERILDGCTSAEKQSIVGLLSHLKSLFETAAFQANRS